MVILLMSLIQVNTINKHLLTRHEDCPTSCGNFRNGGNFEPKKMHLENEYYGRRLSNY
jgi:hypothetical protein